MREHVLRGLVDGPAFSRDVVGLALPGESHSGVKNQAWSVGIDSRGSGSILAAGIAIAAPSKIPGFQLSNYLAPLAKLPCGYSRHASPRLLPAIRVSAASLSARLPI